MLLLSQKNVGLYLMKAFLSAIVLLFSCAVTSLEQSPSSHLKRLISYSQYGNGDVYVQLESSDTICSYENAMNENRSGFKNNFSMLLAAKTANTEITVSYCVDTNGCGLINYVGLR